MVGLLKFSPILKEKVWGGDRLRALAGKDVSPGAKIGESWELADRPDESSVVCEGPLEGETFRDILKFRRNDIYGSGPGPLTNGRFPLLVKFIDAAEKLSVQVHPDDIYAMANGLGDPGKSECWYILDAPKEGIVLGVQEGTSPERFEELARAGRVEECINYEKVTAGQLIYCPAGTLHAITPPMSIVEIQQNSDITFRIHDWGRVGLDGNPRELHVDHALKVARVEPTEEVRPRPITVTQQPFLWEQLLESSKFTVSRWQINSRVSTGEHPNEFEILICVAGFGTIQAGHEDPFDLKTGETVLVPASIRSYSLVPEQAMTLLHVVGKP